MSENPIRVAVVIGTVRPGNYTSKAVALVVDELRAQSGVTVDLIDPATLDLSLPGVESGSSSADELQASVREATAVVLATPEYHGSVSSALKLVIENLGFPSVLAGKPIALLGVAAGAIGAIKSLEQLRSICSHVGAIVLPGPVSIAHVQQVFTAEGACNDEGTEKRVRGLAHALLDYVRRSTCPDEALERMARDD